jgi:hypothetical protein
MWSPRPPSGSRWNTLAAVAIMIVLTSGCSDGNPQSPPTSVSRRIGVYEAMIRQLAGDHKDVGSGTIWVSDQLCSMLADASGDSCSGRITPAEQEELIVRLADLGRIRFIQDGRPSLTGDFHEILLGPIIEKPDGLRVEGGSLCGNLCGTGRMYILLPTETGYEVTGTDDTYGTWVS